MTTAESMASAGRRWWISPGRSGAGTCWPRRRTGVVPLELRSALAGDVAASRYFDGFPPSSRRLVLEWVAKAKRLESRRRRIVTTVELARQNRRAAHPKAAEGSTALRTRPTTRVTGAVSTSEPILCWILEATSRSLRAPIASLRARPSLVCPATSRRVR
ncbi:YdeI/OmpD-associated family protein [Amycolatopsis sp. NPDC004772]